MLGGAGARPAACELPAVGDAARSTTVERRGADHARFCGDASRSGLWHPTGKAFAASPALQASEQLFYEPPVASLGFPRVWKGLGRRSLWGGWYHCSCFASSRRNPSLVGNAAIWRPWHFCLVDMTREPFFLLLFWEWVCWKEKEASAFVKWNKLEFNTAPNNRFKALTQP